MYHLYRERPLLILCIVFANILLSIWCLWLDPVINFDGVTYIKIAELFMVGEFSEALNYYSWPFYSLFVAATAKLFTFSAETAALVFNTLMAISLTLAFVSIVGLLSNHNRRIVLIAAVVILLFPSISKYRAFVIRDFGYLSCYLWSLYFLLRYCSSFKRNHLAAWLIFAGLSGLFRFEGIIFVLIAPYFLFLFAAKTIPHRRTLIIFLSALIAVSSIALMFWYINDKYMDSVEVALQAGKDIRNLTDLFADNFQQRIGDQPLTFWSMTGLITADIVEVSIELIRRMAIFYLAFVVYAYAKGLALQDLLQRRIWLIYVATNIFLLIGFSLSNNFFVSRYVMATVLSLMILAPFAIDRLFTVSEGASKRTRTGLVVTLVILTIVSLEGLDVRTDKHYIKAAGQWVAENVPKDDRVYSNNKLAIYYSQRDPHATLDHLFSDDVLELFLSTNEILTMDYIILIGQKSDPQRDVLRQTLNWRFGMPIQEFYGEDMRRAFVFKIKKAVIEEQNEAS